MNEDLCIEIFKRLSIKNLCKLRSVCKYWNSIISSTIFVNLHYSLTSSIDTLKPYLHVSNVIYIASLYENYDLCHPLDDVEVEHSRQQLHFPFYRSDQGYGVETFSFVNVIRGVVCICHKVAYKHSTSSFVTAILWNPIIHKYVALPCRELYRPFLAIGFGYDASRDDFKVVLINDMVSGKYEVYSDRQGWKTSFSDICKLELTTLFLDKSRPCFVNGTIHWTLKEPKPFYQEGYYYSFCTFSMLMFDCESEEFRRIEIPQPWSAPLHCDSKVGLFEYAGMLAALVDISSGVEHFHFDIWVMEEHGVSTSWKKVFVFPFQLLPYSMPMVICDPSFEKRVGYGPNNPSNKSRGHIETFRNILSDRVFEQSLILMDHPKAQSYTNQEMVPIVITKDSNVL